MTSTIFGTNDNDGHNNNSEKYLTYAQGKDIATRALKKGFAVQKLLSHINKNSINLRHKRIFIARLKANFFGNSDNLDIDGLDNYSFFPCFSDAQFKLLRQEQLSLMAENNKLVRLLESRNIRNSIVNDSSVAISQAISGNIWGCDSLVIKDRSYALEKIVLLLGKVILKILAKAFRHIFLYTFLQDNVQNVKTKIKNNAIRIRMFYACTTIIQAIRNVCRRDLYAFFNSLIRNSTSQPITNIKPLEFSDKKVMPMVPFPTYYKNLHSVKKSQ